MKYRILSLEELEHLQEDLKQFLIVNGVHAEEWEKMNKEEPEKAVQLVEIFSDHVLQKVYEKINFIEIRTPEQCMVFKLENDVMKIITIKRLNHSLDLSTPENIHLALQKHFKDLEFHKGEQVYTKSREVTIHEMMEKGYFLSTEDYWKSLESILL